jgi:hypothetical protein
VVESANPNDGYRATYLGNVTFDETESLSESGSGSSGGGGGGVYGGGGGGDGGGDGGSGAAGDGRGSDGELAPEDYRRKGLHHMAEFDPTREMLTDDVYPYL